MSASTAIGLVSDSLRTLLLDEMKLDPAVEVSVLSPADAGGRRRINLFLYRVEENEFLANQDFLARPGNQIMAPSLSLNLFYLLTVYAQNDTERGNAGAHEILGEAMRVLHQFSPIDLSNAREQLQISASRPDPEELSRIWATFAKPYQLSVLYKVSCVQLDMRVESFPSIPKRVVKVGVPDVRGTTAPPSIEEMSPTAGPAGAELSFSGSNVKDRRVTVTVNDEVLVDTEHALANTFTATLPDDLGTGMYEVKTDVAALFRRSFLFEVKPDE